MELQELIKTLINYRYTTTGTGTYLNLICKKINIDQN